MREPDTRRGSLVGALLGGKLRVLRLLGSGGMGTVYLARHVTLGAPIAVKVMQRDLVSEPSALARFEREARAAAAIDHPNLVRVTDFGDEPFLYIAMEYIEGPTLADLVARHKRLAPERAAHLAGEVLGALAALHDAGIVHRDVKAENVIVQKIRGDDGAPSERAKLCDLGMVKRVDKDTSEEDTSVTATGVIVGTPEYLAPERTLGADADPRSDLYSVGVVLYLALTGRLPFVSSKRSRVPMRHVAEDVAKPSSVVEEVHPGLERVCMRALSKRPEDRYADARAMRKALLESVSERPRRSRVPALAIGIVLVGATLGAAFVALQRRESGPVLDRPTGSDPRSMSVAPDDVPKPKSIATSSAVADPPSSSASTSSPPASAVVVRAGGSRAQPPEARSSRSAASPEPSREGFDPGTARVVATPQQVFGATPSQLLNALGPRAFTSCYREGLRKAARRVGPSTTILRVESDEHGEIIKARAASPEGLPSFGPCIEQLVLRRTIPGIDGKTVIADVKLDLELP